ncbi:LamG domain-containing protein [Spirosoma foliorum]|uniref:LamG domain-containing protein n=1 Tax=Spirosoma foliorum TaxID=2710596 RepID=A0A7G5GRW7_9BACT|nr:LamG domain-containing protein [Spirosoma foliorum]QMW01609.1 LamG domain-containing protein [Spirosoma foliorum]
MKTRQISAWVMAGLVMSAAFTSCKKSDDVATLPPIGGYNGSNDVAATNMIAHWTFDGTNNEAISGTAPSKSTNASFTTGVKGQALQLSSGYLLYPVISSLSSASALGSVTVSAWVNTANNGTTASEYFGLTSPSATDWGQMINLLVETGQKKSTVDTLVLHGFVGQYSSGQRSGQDNVNSGDAADAGNTFKVTKVSGQWTHVVFKYDGSSSTIDIYANGSVVSNSRYRQRGTTGPLVFPTPSQVLIGAFPNVNSGFASSANQVWQGLFNGSIDEVRVYNKALSDTDVSSLYQLEKAGR